MIKRLFIVTALVALALSACNGQAAVETVTPGSTNIPVVEISTDLSATIESTPTPSEASTATSATQPTATITPGTPFPTNPPDCKNSASFVADITIPDNTNVAGGTVFTKTWRINNTGTCVWTPNYSLVYYSQERMNAPIAVPLAVTYPGENLDISVNLTAPAATGTHQANFVIKNPDGLIMKIGDDSRLWALINVTVIGATTAAPTATITATIVSGATTATAITVSSTPSGASTVTTVTPSTANCLFSIDITKLTDVINALNAYRAQKSLPAYTVNAQLAQAAQRQANDAACHKLYVHTGTDGSTPKTRVADTGYVAKSVSENINGNYPPLSAQDVLNWWINDKTDIRHGQNLVSTTFKEIGVGYSFFDNYGFYVIVFAQP
jgi:uncharacterized protein YkwD